MSKDEISPSRRAVREPVARGEVQLEALLKLPSFAAGEAIF
jgi:hypothetical protein